MPRVAASTGCIAARACRARASLRSGCACRRLPLLLLLLLPPPVALVGWPWASSSDVRCRRVPYAMNPAPLR